MDSSRNTLIMHYNIVLKPFNNFLFVSSGIFIFIEPFATKNPDLVASYIVVRLRDKQYKCNQENKMLRTIVPQRPKNYNTRQKLEATGSYMVAIFKFPVEA